MTDFTANQVAIHNVRLPGLRASALILGRSIGRLLKTCGRGLVDASGAYARAQELALLNSSIEKQRLAFDSGDEGRDPSW